MTAFTALIIRNCKLFFKDKGFFFSTLITPIILLVLYATFLANVFKDSFTYSMPEGTPDALINATVGGQLLSSLLAVCCVTVAVCSNMLMVQDKVTASRRDLTITPIKRSTLALAYYVSTLIITLIICLVATGFCFIYIAFMGWYMSVGDVLLLLLDVFLLVMFGTALSSVINYFLTSQGQISAVATIVSCSYGFLCGAYMPIYNFAEGLRNVLCFLPGTYGTSILRNHAMAGAFREMTSLGWPSVAVDGIKNSVDCNLYCFGAKVEMWVMYLVLISSIILLLGIYVLMNMLSAKGKKVYVHKATRAQLQ